jgi:hypothetical protein
MHLKFWRKKWLLAAVVVTVTIVVASLFLATLKFDYDRENDAALQYFSQQLGIARRFHRTGAVNPLWLRSAVLVGLWPSGERVEPQRRH